VIAQRLLTKQQAPAVAVAPVAQPETVALQAAVEPLAPVALLVAVARAALLEPVVRPELVALVALVVAAVLAVAVAPVVSNKSYLFMRSTKKKYAKNRGIFFAYTHVGCT
jgi:hypothetical protein